MYSFRHRQFLGAGASALLLAAQAIPAEAQSTQRVDMARGMDCGPSGVRHLPVQLANGQWNIVRFCSNAYFVSNPAGCGYTSPPTHWNCGSLQALKDLQVSVATGQYRLLQSRSISARLICDPTLRYDGYGYADVTRCVTPQGTLVTSPADMPRP